MGQLKRVGLEFDALSIIKERSASLLKPAIKVILPTPGPISNRNPKSSEAVSLTLRI